MERGGGVVALSAHARCPHLAQSNGGPAASQLSLRKRHAPFPPLCASAVRTTAGLGGCVSARSGRSFGLFLERFAPLVNSFHLGLPNPFLWGPPPSQLVKTQLALQRLTSAAPTAPGPPHAWLNPVLLQNAMFNPRGTLPPRPRGPNPSGTKPPPGSLREGAVVGLPRKPSPAMPQGMSQRLSALETVPWRGSQRINVRVTLHRPDPRQVKKKTNLHQEQKGEPCGGRWDGSSCSAGHKPASSEPNSNPQSRYTPESASSILASFGLSNDDLEELSRYPDDQLTPENMPLILREIRVRKMGHSSGLRAPRRGEESGGGASGAAPKSKVIDYGHASKYGYAEEHLEVHAYDPEVPTEDPLEAAGYRPEASSGEDFQGEPNVPMGVPPPPPAVSCNAVFPVDDLMKPAGFQNGSSTSRSFFPTTEPPEKLSGLCAAPAGLPVVKPISQPPLPPGMPALLPLPLLPPVLLPPPPPPVLPPAPHPPFSAGLLAAISSHERLQRDVPPSHPGGQSGAGAAPKAFPEEPLDSPFGKASWLPAFPEADGQKRKRAPTPSMMNDYYATSPRIFPHICSLCNIECTHMKYWILHQNSPSHIESCRHLRQQYPDWNPESHSSKRNAADRKENQTPRRRSGSASPRRSRLGSSSYVIRRSRSRSRSPGRFRPTRPRSRSPRQMRRFSPRHRSRSPQRSRNPLRTTPRPQRSSSNDWSSRRSTRSQGKRGGKRSEMAALETLLKSLGFAFVAEFNEQKGLRGTERGPSGSGKSPPSPGPLGKVPGNAKKPLKTGVSPKALKKDDVALPPSSSSSPATEDLLQSKEVEENEEEESMGTPGPCPAPYNRLLREELLSRRTVLRISELPQGGFSDQDIKKIVQPFGKVSDLLVLRSRNEAFLEMNYKEAVVAAVEYGETVPVLVNGKRVKISVAERPKAPPGQTKTILKKRSPTTRRAAPSAPKDPNPTAAAADAAPGKKETKESAVKGDTETQTPSIAVAEAAVDEDLPTSTGVETELEGTKPMETQSVVEWGGVPEETEAEGGTDAASAEEVAAREPLVALEMEDLDGVGIHEGAVAAPAEREETLEPPGKDPEDTCVVLVSNLPEKGYSVEDVSNLAKPFGGVRDVLIVSSHKKAFLEIPRSSAHAMVRFYRCFPMSLDGNQLCVATTARCSSVSDEEAIFTALIQESDPKVDTAGVRRRFVHLGNLPDDGYRELEAVCVGLRFGKVDHYVVLKNRKKAIVQLDSPEAARSMQSFLQRCPYRMGDHTLTCTLSPHHHSTAPEVGKKEVKKEEPPGGSSDLPGAPEGSGAAQRAAADPPAEPQGPKERPPPIPKIPEELPTAPTEPSESRLDGAVRRESAPGPPETSVEPLNAGVEATVVSIKAVDTEWSEAKSEEIPPPLSGAEEEEVVGGNVEAKWFGSVFPSASEQEAMEEDEEVSSPSVRPPEGSAAVGEAEDAPPDGVVKLEGWESTGTIPEVVPPASPAASVETASPPVPQPSKKLDSSEEPLVSGVKTNQEVPRGVAQTMEEKPTLESEVAAEKKLDTTGAETEVEPEEPQLRGGRAEEKPEKLLVKSGVETETKLGKSTMEVGAALENVGSAVKENKEGIEVHRNGGVGQPGKEETFKAVPLSSSLSLKECPSVDKTIWKAVLCLPDISKSRSPSQRKEPGAEQKAPAKPGPRGHAAVKRTALKEEEEGEGEEEGGEGHLRGGSVWWSAGDGVKRRASRSCGVDGKGGGGGRSSSQQEKAWRAPPRASSKLSQEGQSRSTTAKRDNGGTKVPVATKAAAASKGGAGAKHKEEEELFPFKLDEFVTVDEVIEETEPPVKTRQNPPRGRRKDGAKATSSSEPSSKRRKGKSSVPRLTESDLSFVTLDEIGEEEDMGVAGLEALGDPRGLLVVDEVMEEEELLEAVKDPQSLVTLDELSEQEELSFPHEVPRSLFEEQDLKAQPLVTVDEIGEVEELPLSQPTDLMEDVLTAKEDNKAVGEESGDGVSSQVLDDPRFLTSPLVTVDELQEDNEDNPLEALDEGNEEDFLADFNRLKEELNFVTVDEVGEEDEEEETASLGKNVSEEEDDEDIVAVAGPEEEEEVTAVAGAEEEDIVAVAGPEEMEILGEMSPGEDIVAISKAKGEPPESGEKEPESGQKKTAPSDAPKPSSTQKGLDYLLPKAGFFCQICSLFYTDETSVKNHCKTPLHQQNLEKFMAEQKDAVNAEEERSSR
ncbi:LOW QUALITY PROTEIN: zinc finger protein 638 [Cuculus canorus]|uniref:LOW QUALITY PROTEIN: zinc finger protein 638 n=1 Tax=Cuculus canorus TaxID=55661 RepID=UPI0023AAD044|nr:LOW QUALITY PROTEIN: zinc finger protein 638 [Cuculus canorus]